MKKFLSGAALVGVLFVVTGCGASGSVEDKRAPGWAGEKTYEIQLRDHSLVGPDEVWVKVPERVWDACDVHEFYPDCAG